MELKISTHNNSTRNAPTVAVHLHWFGTNISTRVQQQNPPPLDITTESIKAHPQPNLCDDRIDRRNLKGVTFQRWEGSHERGAADEAMQI